MSKNTRFLTHAAIIAALYAVLLAVFGLLCGRLCGGMEGVAVIAACAVLCAAMLMAFAWHALRREQAPVIALLCVAGLAMLAVGAHLALLTVKPGRYTLRFEAYGYHPRTEPVVVQADRTAYVLTQMHRVISKE